MPNDTIGWILVGLFFGLPAIATVILIVASITRKTFKYVPMIVFTIIITMWALTLMGK